MTQPVFDPTPRAESATMSAFCLMDAGGAGIFHQMPPVSDLNGVRTALRGGLIPSSVVRRIAGSRLFRITDGGKHLGGDVVAPEIGRAEIAQRHLGRAVPCLAHQLGQPGARIAGRGGKSCPQ
jgi:hypothetical protein